MSLKIYHQTGHNTNWNLDSLTLDKCGDGLILSPVHQARGKIESLNKELKSRSIFDPQYYLPNSQKKNLTSYSFFPEVISSGFSTIEFHTLAHQSAEECIAFQIAQDFEKIIIPTRYIDQLKTNYIEQQEEYSLLPFLKVLSTKKVDKPIFVTLALTSHMIEDEGFRTKILNWITSYPEINGVYILVSHERDTKQIQSESFLKSYLDFLVTLKEAELEIILGHTNTESLIYSVVDNINLTFGTFENTRIFSIDKFVEIEEDRRGPKARIYLPNLLNWIQYSQAKEILAVNPALWKQIYTPTPYSEQALATTVEPTFNQSPLYKHHFLCFSSQISELSVLDQTTRCHKIIEWIEFAKENYSRIRTAGIQIENHGNHKHLAPWENTINYFYKTYLKT